MTGLVVVPDGPAPDDGWPVVTWAHGTTGLADTCAPSVDPSDLARLANVLLDAGYLVTATDYEGQGTPGVHPYLAGLSEGRGVLDIVTAARNMDVAAGDRYLIWGHSQGGHAALFAGHEAAEVLPDLTLVGRGGGGAPLAAPAGQRRLAIQPVQVLHPHGRGGHQRRLRRPRRRRSTRF